MLDDAGLAAREARAPLRRMGEVEDIAQMAGLPTRLAAYNQTPTIWGSRKLRIQASDTHGKPPEQGHIGHFVDETDGLGVNDLDLLEAGIGGCGPDPHLRRRPARVPRAAGRCGAFGVGVDQRFLVEIIVSGADVERLINERVGGGDALDGDSDDRTQVRIAPAAAAFLFPTKMPISLAATQ